MEKFGILILGDDEDDQVEFSLSKPTVEIGRAALNDIVLSDHKISRSHARIECDETGCTLIDLGSSNGTLVNGDRIDRAKLVPGDVIQLGGSILHFEEIASLQDPEMTMLNTEADVRASLASTMINTSLNDVSESRIVIHNLEKTWEVPIEETSLLIGRDPACDIVFDDIRLSRRHAEIVGKEGIFTIRDLQSTNGTWIDQKRIDKHVLIDSDEILIGKARIVFKRGFRQEELTFVASMMKKIPRHRPVVFVPGFMGSQLWRGSERVWPNVRLMFSQPEILRIPDSGPIEPRGIVEEVVIVPNLLKQDVYSRLGDYLVEGLGYERGKDLFEFAYDFRLDVRTSARKMIEAIDDWNIDSPITIIAHSLGCLVSRYYIERLGGDSKVERLILLGGPHSGIPHILKTFHVGRNLLPLGILGDRLRETLVTFPSIYQILPTYASVIDQDGKYINLLKDDSWLPEIQRPYLRQAREFRQELKKTSSVPTISIFGYGIKTISQLQIHRDRNGTWQNVEFIDAPGDDRIPESTAVLKGSEIHPVQQHHGSLFVDNDVRMRLKLELMRD